MNAKKRTVRRGAYLMAVSSLAVCGFCGCAKNENNIPDSAQILSGSDASQSKSLFEAASEQSDTQDVAQFTQTSQPIDVPAASAMPLGLSDNGMIALNLRSGNGEKIIGVYNSRTNKLTSIKVMDTQYEDGEFYLAGMNTQMMVFGESLPTEEGILNRVYLYSFENQQTSQIAQYGSFSPDTAIASFNDDEIYLNYRVEDSYKTFRLQPPYDMEKTEVLIDVNSSSIIALGDRLYYIELDNSSQATTLWEMDSTGQQKREVLASQYEDGWLYSLFGRGDKILLVKVAPDNSRTDLVLLDPKTGESEVIHTFERFLNDPQVGADVMTWWGYGDTSDRPHTMYSVFDLDEGKLIPYTDSELFVSEYGIVWTRFLSDPWQIAPGEIFESGNSKIMLYKFPSAESAENG